MLLLCVCVMPHTVQEQHKGTTFLFSSPCYTLFFHAISFSASYSDLAFFFFLIVYGSSLSLWFVAKKSLKVANYLPFFFKVAIFFKKLPIANWQLFKAAIYCIILPNLLTIFLRIFKTGVFFFIFKPYILFSKH